MHDLSSIRAFDALNEHKSLTAAAKALNQPKSTISRRLAQLEADVGQALTIRQGNRLVITKAGQVFARYSKKMLELADESQDAIQGLNNQVSGELQIICHPALMRGWISTALNRFLADNPKVRIRMSSEYVADIHNPDLIVWVGQIPDLDWRKQTLGHWYYSAYAAPEYLVNQPKITHPKQLQDHPWIDFGSVREAGLVLNHHQAGDYFLEPIESRLQCDNLALQVDSIANGNGIGLLPKSMANGYLQHHPGRIVDCLPGWQTEPVEINYYTQVGRPPRRLLALVDVLEQNVPDTWQRQYP